MVGHWVALKGHCWVEPSAVLSETMKAGQMVPQWADQLVDYWVGRSADLKVA